MNYVQIGDKLVHISQIEGIDLSKLDDLVIKVFIKGFPRWQRSYDVVGIQAIDLLMIIRPSVLESRRLRWKRHAWAFHNLIGHPLMQILAFFKKYYLAMAVHDFTVPRPIGKR